MVTQTYKEASRSLLAQAESELAAGDVRQASEKGWGAAAQMVKSVAERRGWAHRSHASLYNAIAQLVSETGDDEIRRLFAVAGDLHVNFYENWNNADNVAAGLADVQRLLDRLEPFA
ncbi:MAG: PaREP1 family protein [Chloroflexi bacterium]|nr:PaREP1 family protein [Chloroflexota bacterium]